MTPDYSEEDIVRMMLTATFSSSASNGGGISHFFLPYLFVLMFIQCREVIHYSRVNDATNQIACINRTVQSSWEATHKDFRYIEPILMYG